MPEAHNNLGNVYRALGHFAEARWCYGEAVRQNPEMSQACVSLALTLQQEGRWDEALPWLRRATEVQPGSLDYLVLLAEAEVDREHFAEAIDCYQEIIKRDPGDATAHNALGWLLQEEGQLDRSAEHLRTALRLQPDLAVAHVTLGSLHEKTGDFAAAEACFRTAVDDARSPEPRAGAAGDALARQAARRRLQGDRRAGSPTPDATDPARLNLFFGLANVWDARRRYPEAAACARQANALALAQFQRRNMVHDPAEHERFVSGLIEAFEPALFERLANAGLETRRPVFIVGLPRSGTTLIEQILASHSQFHGAGELPLARHDFQAIPGLLDRDLPPVSCISGLTREVVRQLALGHDDKLRSLDGGMAARIGDKMPDNYIHLGLLATLFPNAVFIHCRRDLRDVAVSCWMTGFRSVRWTNDTHHIATRFQQYDRLMKHWQAVLPAPIHHVDYEETVDDLEGVARRLLEACGLEWEPACLEFHRNSRPVQTASFSQVRQPVYRGSVGRWKNYETELADLFAALPARVGLRRAKMHLTAMLRRCATSARAAFSLTLRSGVAAMPAQPSLAFSTAGIYLSRRSSWPRRSTNGQPVHDLEVSRSDPSHAKDASAQSCLPGQRNEARGSAIAASHQSTLIAHGRVRLIADLPTMLAAIWRPFAKVPDGERFFGK